MSPDDEATWSAFPSLLLDLTSEERQVVETAVCAGLCGRQVDCDRIFDDNHARVAAFPAYVLSRADLLTNASREQDRYEILRALVVQGDADTSLQMLLNFMIEDNQFWMYGKVHSYNAARKATKDYLAQKNLVDLSDLELRCLTLYYDATANLAQHTKLISKQDHTCFSTSGGSRYAEVRQLRQTLQGQGRYRFAPTFMQLELSNCSSFQDLSKSLSDAEAMVGHLEAQAHSAIRYRGAVLANQLSARVAGLNMHTKKANLDTIKVHILQEIKSSDFREWESYCPAMAADDENARIMASSLSCRVKVDALNRLADACIEEKSYTKANQALIKARDVLHDTYMSTNDSTLLSDIRSNGSKFLDFHKTRTHLAYFESVALGDYISTGYPRDKPNRMIVNLIRTYVARHPDMEIPTVQQRLSDIGRAAAADLADPAVLDQFNALMRRSRMRTPYLTEDGAFAEEVILDPHLSTRVINAKGNDHLSTGIGSLHLMLRWAAVEICSGDLGSEEAAIMFSESVAGSVGEIQLQSTSLFEKLCGTKDSLTASPEFLMRYHLLLSWILQPDRKPTGPARPFALKYFLQARLYLHAQHLKDLWNDVNPGDSPAELEEKRRLIAEATRAPKEEQAALSSLNQIAGIRQTENDVQEIQAVLVRARTILPNDPEAAMMTDDLQQSYSKCRQLADTYKAESAYKHQYGSLCQLIRLNWQINILSDRFTKADTEALMTLVEEADLVSDQLRAAMASPNASAELIASIKTSNDYLQAEHYKYGFAALYRQYKSFPETEHGVASQLACLSIRSKAKALGDIFDRSASNQEDAESSSTDHPNASMQTLTIDEKDKAANGIVDGVRSMLDDDIVVVDLVDVSYSTLGARFLALLYKKVADQIVMVDIPLALSEVQEWVTKQLDSKDSQMRELSQSDSQGTLDIFSPLVDAFLDSKASSHIPKDATIVWCPTGALHRVPIHAVKAGEQLLIQRNPISYTQGLSLLYQSWQRYNAATVLPSAKKIILCPLDSSYDITAFSAELAESLPESTLLGQHTSIDRAVSAIDQSSIFTFIGHAIFDSAHALNSGLVLDSKKLLSCEYILDNIKLAFPALCALIACASGKSSISDTDNLLSLSTAFEFAGASNVISTLWIVDNLDAAVFARCFFCRLSQAASEASVLNLARIMQQSLIETYDKLSDEGKDAPFHWAAFFMQGLWMFPSELIHESSPRQI